MRKLLSVLALVLLVGGAGVVTATQPVHAATKAVKAVIVVGATQGVTPSYRSDADAAAAAFPSGTEIVKVYSPNATWSAVAAAAVGANILIYLGHGSGYPSPYLPYYAPGGDNGMGLNASAGHGDSNTTYYGEDYMAKLALAPNAIVILNHLCYASGDSEPGHGKPTLDVAKTRIDGYASGFIRAGAKAVIAEGMNNLSYYINALFTTHTTIDALFQNQPWFHHNLSSWTSSRSVGYTSYMDPDISNPQPDGDIYYRSMVSIPTTTTDDIIAGVAPAFVGQSGTYHPTDTIRVVDTRYSDPGPVGQVRCIGSYNFKIAGVKGIPANAIAVTANVTVTDAKLSAGWVFLGPEIWSKPSSSTINFPLKDTRANGVTVGLSGSGMVSAWFSGGATNSYVNLVIDVTGWFTPDASGYGFVKFGPKRILDTRAGGTGLSGAFVSGTPRAINVANVQGLPATGIKAVVGNLTVTGATTSGYAYLGPLAPADPLNPTSSTINFKATESRANNFVVQVAADGTISLDWVGRAGATADFVIDIAGYFVAGGGSQFHTVPLTRIMDSRVPLGLAGIVPGSTSQTLSVVGHASIPSGAVAVVANLTVTGQEAGGWIAAGPTVDASTLFSNLNFPKGDNRANGVVVPINAADGTIQFVYGVPITYSTHMVLDVTGYYK